MALGPWSSDGLIVLGAVALGASCGLRIFLAPFVVCLLALLGVLDSGPELASSPWAAIGATALVLVEVAADKVRGLDQALDAAGLVLRPTWAAALVLGFAPPEVALVPALVAAAVALLVGTGKARLRLESAQGTWQGPLLSLAEDVVAAALVALALVSPGIAIAGWAGVGLVAHASTTAIRRVRWRVAAA